MKKILLFTGSNSLQSINRTLIEYAARQLSWEEHTMLDLKDYTLPIFSTEIEEKEGVPQNAKVLNNLIQEHDLLVISVPEHNGSVPAFFKNVLDWVSRAQKKYRVFENKSVLLLSTSPGKSGGSGALAHAEVILSRLGGSIIGKLSIPSYYDNVSIHEGNVEVNNKDIAGQFNALLAKLSNGIAV